MTFELLNFCKTSLDIFLSLWRRFLAVKPSDDLFLAHDASCSLFRPTKQGFLGRSDRFAAERLPSVAFHFRLLPGNQNEGIKTTKRFSGAKVGWSRQILRARREHLLRHFQVPWQLVVCCLCHANEQASLHLAARTFLDFSKSLSLRMFSGDLLSVKYL